MWVEDDFHKIWRHTNCRAAPIVPLNTGHPIYLPGLSTRSCACGEACLTGLLQQCRSYGAKPPQLWLTINSCGACSFVVSTPCALLGVATDLLVPCLELSITMACTVLSSSLTLALCVGTRLLVHPSGALFSPWPWSFASFISCLPFSYGITKHSPHSIHSTCTVQRHPTTARLGQWTLARLAEPLPSSQVSS
ncbi:hypothetical protein HAX54_022239 [Datura stramonium]|uniref:Uncharacterized protein n=1 Tax=Datura stramonium TaxID=4076 RepID=A0ABS8UUA1_DATST|nr:hypothetical protein [Datura stramonium]